MSSDLVCPTRHVADLPAGAVTPTTKTIRLLLDRRAAAAALSISVSLLDLLVRRGEVRPTYIGRLPRFTIAELERFISQRGEGR